MYPSRVFPTGVSLLRPCSNFLGFLLSSHKDETRWIPGLSVEQEDGKFVHARMDSGLPPAPGHPLPSHPRRHLLARVTPPRTKQPINQAVRRSHYETKRGVGPALSPGGARDFGHNHA